MREVVAALLLAALPGCRGTPHAARRASVPARAEAAPSVAPPQPESFLGVVVAPQTVDVTSQVAGRVGTVEVRGGDPVKQGSVLARLDTRSARHEVAVARAELATAIAQREQARLDAAQASERLQRRSAVVELHAESVRTVSEEELSASEYQKDAARARLQAAEAQVAEKQARLAQMELLMHEDALRAPFDGVVIARYVDAGASVHQGTPVVRLLESGDLRVRFAMPEDVDEPAVGTAVRIDVAEQTLHGIVDKVAPEIDAASRMIFAELSLTAPLPRKRLRSGEVARVIVDSAMASAP